MFLEGSIAPPPVLTKQSRRSGFLSSVHVNHVVAVHERNVRQTAVKTGGQHLLTFPSKLH